MRRPPASRRLVVVTLSSVLAASTAWSASPPAQAPNPLPRGLFDDAPVFDPAADDAAPPPAPDPAPEPPPPPTPTTAPTAPAATDRIRLIYAPGPWAGVCPAADDVPGLVRQHLSADPFGEPATRVALIALDGPLDRAGAVPVRARVELLDLELQPIGSRVVEAGDGCAELVATAAFQLAMALDPLAGTRVTAAQTDPADPVPPSPGQAGPTAPPAPITGDSNGDGAPSPAGPPTDPTPASADEAELFLTGGAFVAALLAPEGAMAGMSVGAGARLHAVSLRAEGRVDLSGGDQGTTSIPVLATILPCAHLPLVDLGATDGIIEATGCITLSAGVMPAFGVYTGFGVYAGSGGRVGVDWHMPGEITLRSFAQVEAAGLRPQLVNLSSGNIYESPAFNILLGMGMDLPDL